MAGEEDVELRDLVAHTLETKGVLGKIRAQLRASVFLALEEQESQQKPHPLVSNKFQQYLKTRDGQAATSLVREFLNYFDLDYTCSVFDPETNALETYPGRDQLARDLGLDTSSSNGPLLASVIHRATSSATTPSMAASSPTSTAASRALQGKELHPTCTTHTFPPPTTQANSAPHENRVFTSSDADASMTTHTGTSLLNPWSKGASGLGGGGGGDNSPLSMGELGELVSKSQVASGLFHGIPSTNGVLGDGIGSSGVGVCSGDVSHTGTNDAAEGPRGASEGKAAGDGEIGIPSPGNLSTEEDTDDFFNPKLPAKLHLLGTRDLKLNSYEDDFHSENISENSNDRSQSKSHVKFEETEDFTVSENSCFGSDIDFTEAAKT